MQDPTRAPVIEHTSVPVEGGALPLAVARGGGAGAAVVVMPSAFGIGPDLEAQLTDLAVDARLVIAFDPFFRDGRGLLPYEDMAGVMTRVRGLDTARAYEDLRAALAWTRAQVPGPIVAVGVCLGAPFVLTAAADGLVDGVVTWHGSRMPDFLGRVAEMRCPMRHHVGGADPFVPPAAVDAIRTAFAGASDVEIVVHDGATHGFSHRSAAAAYQPAAERAAMDAVRALAGHLASA